MTQKLQEEHTKQELESNTKKTNTFQLEDLRNLKLEDDKIDACSKYTQINILDLRNTGKTTRE